MNKKIYTGGCHCGAIQYTAQIGEIESVISCNCSYCSKRGYLLTFVPKDDFTLEKGEDHLTDYQFNKKRIHHVFCKTCGIESFATGKDRNDNEMVSINVRCLAEISPEDLEKIPVQKVNGRAN